MQSPFDFIVRPVNDSRYNNTKSIGGVDVVVNSSEEDHRFSNRYAEVIALPRNYKGDVSVGDILLVHHNVFKFYNDIKGNRKSDRSFFRDNTFFVEPDQFFMYKHDGQWYTHDRYCFVKPMAAIESYIMKPFTKEPLMGVMRYPNKFLLDRGVNDGDTICFKPDSEYEFDVDGEKLYRIFDHQITMKL